MNEAVKGAATGAAFGGVIWITTGIWQFFAVTMVGVVCAWLFSPPARPQPRRRVRDFVHVEIRDVDKIVGAYSNGMTRACYDYGGCQWAGDGCAGKPLVLGPGKGCMHTAGRRVPDDNPSAMRFASTHESDCTCPHCDPD